MSNFEKQLDDYTRNISVLGLRWSGYSTHAQKKQKEFLLAIEAYIAERVLEELKQVPFSYIRIESGDEYFPTQSTEYLQKRLEELASENT